MNIINKVKKLIVLCYLITNVISCNKYLDKKQDDSKAIPSNLNDLQALLDNGFQTNGVSPAYSESSSDEFYISNETYKSFDDTYQRVYKWQKIHLQPGAFSDWITCYAAIYYDNLVIDLLKKINPEKEVNEKRKELKGSALFYRSYHFLNLLWEYAKAFDEKTAKKDYGIVLRKTSDFNVPSTRATVQQSYNQVIADTKASITLLPNYPAILTRPSKGAAYGLLARCYLSMGDYKNALLYSDSSLQLNNELIDFNGDGDIIRNLKEDVPFKQFNKETIFYCEMSYNLDIFSYVGNVDTSIINQYDSNDLRRIAYINRSSEIHYFKASYSGNITPYFTGIATDEMYLIRAECNVREGNENEGLKDLNTLLTKRYKKGTFIPLKELSQKEALTVVLQERRKELLFRGNRWIDIKRLNKEGANIIQKRIINNTKYKLLPNANFYAMPLPEDIIKITGMPQND